MTVLGDDPERAGTEWRQRIGVVLQSSAVYGTLSVHEMLALFAGYYREPRPVDEVIELVGLEAKRDARVKSLSGGQAAGSISGSRSSAIPSWSSWTSRRRASTPARAGPPGRRSARCARSAKRSC